MGVRDYTFYDVIRRNGRIFPDREALVHHDTRMTYRQYKDRCDEAAAGLHRAGVRRGDRIGVVAHNSDTFLILYGAAAKLGAVVVPVNWRFQEDEVRYVLRDAAPKVLFAGSPFQEMLRGLLPRLEGIEACYSMEWEEGAAPFVPFDAVCRTEPLEEEPDLPEDAGFVIIHTAAVDGRPKGALLSHRNILAGNAALRCLYGLGPQDVHLCFVPLFHMAGLTLSASVMEAGGKNVLMERFDPADALNLLVRERGTVFFDFAPILKNLLDEYDRKGGYDVSSLRHVVGLDQPDTIRRFLETVPGARFWSVYGQTEVLIVSQAPFDEKPGSAGKPCPQSRVALMDEYDREVPVGEAGEICVRSPQVFLGYWGLEEDTAYTFRNGWHHTGDIGRFDEEGYLWYVKRKAQKELIKPGGENVYPAEVEKAILEHEAVKETCVIGVPDPDWGEAIKAVCVLKQDMEVGGEELREFVASRIARYKKPKYVVFVEAFPRTPEGEIDREEVKRRYGNPA